MRTPLGLLVAAACLAFAAPAMAADHMYGITQGPPPHLVSFEAQAPVVYTHDALIMGFAGGAGEGVVGMDVSPRDGGLYVLTNEAGVGRLYSLDPGTAALTLIGTLAADPADSGGAPQYSTLPPGDYGVDFIPQSNLLRVVANSASPDPN